MTLLFNKQSLLLVLGFFVASCANYKIHPSDESARIQATAPPTGMAITHTMYLVGDAGDATSKTHNKALKLLKSHLEQASENSSVLFLGDNIYPVGMPPKSEGKKRDTAEMHFDSQLDALANFKGRPIFIPGNHDWYKYGVKGLDRQERYIEKHLNKMRGVEDDEDDNWGNYFLPDEGCSGPIVVEIDDKLIVIVIDSQWWLSNWDKVPNINDGCEFKTRADFNKAFSDAVRKNKNKNIVIALHHPLHSNGIHGGNTSLKDHIFPLESFAHGLYIPLPILGTVIQSLRASLGSRQDISNSHYRDMRENLTEPAEDHGEFIFVSGHEHSLQYFKKENQHFIISGSGSKKTPTVGNKQASFAYGHEGFSKIDFYKDGSAWLEFWIPNETGTDGKRVFRQQIKEALKNPDVDIPESFPEYDDPAPTILKYPITTEVKPAGKFQTAILGKHYRDIYLEKHEFPKLDLGTYKGGVDILLRGGGMQTNSLRMADAQGRQYVMRSLTKDHTRAIPYPLNKVAFISFLFKDNYLASQPFAPLAIPTLAEAANVYYAKSEIYYIPKQPVLKGFNVDFGGEIYITEERAAKDWRDLANFGNSKKIISTPDLTLKTQKSSKHFVDQNWVARSRLFDLVIGDWDRHSDQWRWARTETDDGKKRYRPIPRDRDQAFSKYDGALVKILRPWSHFLKQLPDYTEEVKNMEWAYYNGRHFDHYVLNELSLEGWLKEAAYIKQHLTDDIIDEAFQKMPPRAQELSAEQIKKVLRARRDNLPQLAKELYLVLSKQVGVVGTEKKDYFDIIRQDDEHTLVAIYPIGKKEEHKKKPFYERVFKTSETKEIFIYGLGGDDVFHLEGEVKKGIKIHIVGGLDDDKVVDNSKVAGLGKKDKIYDSKDGIDMTLGSEGKNKTSDISRKNAYNRMGNMYDANVGLPIPILSVNLDDKFLFGFQHQIKVMGFNKAPYKQLHSFGGDFATSTNGLRIAYDGEFIESNGRWDFVINSEFKSGRNSFNYFGEGNESERTADRLLFNRVQQSSAYLDFGWQRRFSSNFGRFSIRPLISVTDIKEVAGRFVATEESGLEKEDFEAKFYGGLLLALDFKNIDNIMNPKSGIHFQANASYQNNLEENDKRFIKLGSSLTLYQSFDKKERLTFATRIGAEFIDGTYEFFQAPTLGREENLRGFFPERYRGKSTFFHTSDLRWELFSTANVILPLSLGIFGSFDYGRLWVANDTSELWHSNYGGGLWITPFDLVVLSFGYHISDDDEQFIFKVNHSF